MIYSNVVKLLNQSAKDDLERVQLFTAILREVFMSKKHLDLKKFSKQVKERRKKKDPPVTAREYVTLSITKSALYERYVASLDAFRNGLGDYLLPVLRAMDKSLANLIVRQTHGLTDGHQAQAKKENIFSKQALDDLNTIRLVVHQAINRIELIGTRRRVMARAWLGMIFGVSLTIAMVLAFAVYSAMAAPLVPAILLGVGALLVILSAASFIYENKLHKQMVEPIKEHTGVDLSGPKKAKKEETKKAEAGEAKDAKEETKGDGEAKSLLKASQIEHEKVQVPTDFSQMTQFWKSIPETVKEVEREAYDTVLVDTKGPNGMFKRFV